MVFSNLPLGFILKWFQILPSLLVWTQLSPESGAKQVGRQLSRASAQHMGTKLFRNDTFQRRHPPHSSITHLSHPSPISPYRSDLSPLVWSSEFLAVLIWPSAEINSFKVKTWFLINLHSFFIWVFQMRSDGCFSYLINKCSQLLVKKITNYC